MDNITHALIGVTMGACVARAAGVKRGSALERGAVWTAAIGNNLPDLDILLRPFLGAGNLGYLLHHRGHSHTLPLVLPLGLLAAWLGARAGRLRGRPPGFLIALGFASVLMHIGADYWNNYGVHPFWPFVNRWFYGDAIFIVEPLLWAALLPFAFVLSRARGARALWALLGLAMLAVAWTGPFLAPHVAAVLSLAALCSCVAQWRTRSCWISAGGALTVLLAFTLARGHARREVMASYRESFGTETLRQLSSTPMPANPLCWQILAVSDDGRSYRARQGWISLNPSMIEPEECILSRMRGEPTAQRQPENRGSTERLKWQWVHQGSLETLRRLYREDCRFAALARFARVPYWNAAGDPLTGVAGDLRYDREPGLGFAETALGPSEPCPPVSAPWEPPALELMKPSTGRKPQG